MEMCLLENMFLVNVCETFMVFIVMAHLMLNNNLYSC